MSLFTLVHSVVCDVMLFFYVCGSHLHFTLTFIKSEQLDLEEIRNEHLQCEHILIQTSSYLCLNLILYHSGLIIPASSRFGPLVLSANQTHAVSSNIMQFLCIKNKMCFVIVSPIVLSVMAQSNSLLTSLILGCRW